MWTSSGLVAGDGGVDEAGPGVDAAGDGLGLVKSLLAEPCGDREGASTVMAEDEYGSVFVEFLVGAARNLIHGDEGAAVDVRGGVFPWLADVEEERWVGGGEEGAELFYSDFEVHDVCLVFYTKDTLKMIRQCKVLFELLQRIADDCFC